jgi:hypothetical protein
LERVQGILRQIGLYERMCGLVSTKKGDGGFCPRYVAGSTTLSGHAFGLAVDIDNIENPRIVGADIIPLLNEAVKRQSGLDYDFGSQFLERLQNYRILDNRQQDRDLQILKLLKAKRDRNKLDSWAQIGIVNLPIELVAAFYVAFSGDPNFLWGGSDYHDSKDFMHFELQPLPDRQHRRPGCLTATRSYKSKQERPEAIVRTLEELFPSWAQMSAFLAFENPEIDDLLEQIRRGNRL